MIERKGLKRCQYCEGRGMRETRDHELYTCDHCKGTGDARAEPTLADEIDALETLVKWREQNCKALELLPDCRYLIDVLIDVIDNNRPPSYPLAMSPPEVLAKIDALLEKTE